RVCAPPRRPQPVPAAPAEDFPHRSAVAASGDRVLFTWIVDGALHARTALTSGTFASADTVLLARPTAEEIDHARVAGLSDGSFVLAVRSARSDDDADSGRI